MISLRHGPKCALQIPILFALILSLPIAVTAKDRHGKSRRENPRGTRLAIAKNKKAPAKQTRRQVTARRGRLAHRNMEARRRAEAARLAALARERAGNEALREKVRAMIANDDPTGEDLEVRRIAVNALGDHAGTVVVMDPQTGRVYSIVNQQWAVREGFKPCSTIELVTGLAGLNEHVIDRNNTADISESNKVDLTKALAHSKNDYFQQVGRQLGFVKMLEYSRQLGLGEKTGLNVRDESSGRLPAYKYGFDLNRMSSHGDNFQVTALQLATLVSAMANGGRLLKPYLAYTPKDETRFNNRVRRHVKIDADTWRYMIPGMVGAVNYGSGRKAHDPSKTVAGKTGTCIEQGGWVGLFTSCAPLVNPKLAVVVIARGADARSHFPAAVAGRIYRDLNGRFGNSQNLQLASTVEISPSRPSEVDDEEADEFAATNGDSNVPGHREAAKETIANTTRTIERNTRTKPVLMQIPSRGAPPVRTHPSLNVRRARKPDHVAP